MQFADGQIVVSKHGVKYKVLWTCTNRNGPATYLFVRTLCKKRATKKVLISEVKSIES